MVVMMERSKAWLQMAGLFLLGGATTAQLIGVDICACQPSVITFRLNFTIDCTESNVFGPGIVDTACIVETRGSENVTDKIPTIITSVQVLELYGPELVVVGQSTYEEGYINGDEITYTSIVTESPETINASNIPSGFQVVITGLNVDEDTLVNQWIITYNNDCGIFPLLTVGQQIGWSVFVSIAPFDTAKGDFSPYNSLLHNSHVRS
jgi:hypothetical protein